MKSGITALVFVTLCIPGSCSLSQEVLSVPVSKSTLNDRWSWAVQEVQGEKYAKGVWIVYSIDKLMYENSWTGSFRSYPRHDEMSLHEAITGQRVENPNMTEDDIRETARRVLSKAERKRTEKKVVKELAFLFRFDQNSGQIEHLKDLRMSNMSLSVELDNLAIVWLGKVGAEESLDLLADLYPRAVESRQKKRIITAVGIHDANQKSLKFFTSVLADEKDNTVRDDAAFWLGQQDMPEALRLLADVARNDRSTKVAEKAVFAISQMSVEGATDTLIDLGRKGPSREIRKKAVFWLGQQASEKAAQSLKEFAYEDGDSEIQKSAVFALSQLGNGKGVSEMIRIAETHPNPRIRKQAIFWLGQSEDPRAFETIVRIAKGE